MRIGRSVRCRAWPRDEVERRRAIAAGLPAGPGEGALDARALAGAGDAWFAATGVTGSALLDPVAAADGREAAHSCMCWRSGDRERGVAFVRGRAAGWLR